MNKKTVDFDDILDEIGEFGRFQKVKYFLLCIPVFFGAANSLSYVFTAGKQHYRCLIPECEIDTPNEYYQNWLPHAIPGEIQLDGSYKIDHCLRFKSALNETKLPQLTSCSVDFFLSSVEPCKHLIFDKSSSLTIAGKFGITCTENEWKLPFVGTTHFLGIIVGSLWMPCGDFLGRKNTLIMATFFMSLTGIGQALSTSYDFFVFFAFLNAIGISGVFPLAFVLGIELVGRRKRGQAGIICNYFYSIGVASLGLLAWVFKDYAHLQLIISIPPMIIFIYIWIVPESVRWLVSKKKYEPAVKIIEEAAAYNGVILSNSSKEFLEKLENKNDCGMGQSQICSSLKLLLKKKIMWLRSIVLLYNFAVNALVYFSLSLNSVSLSGNKYFNFILVSLVEIPGYWFGLFIINKYGRVPGFIASMTICGITCIFCGYVETIWIQTLGYLIGKMGITSSFSIIYVHAAEIMPTVVRSSTLGFFSTMSRIGALACPFIPFLEKYYKPLPFIVCGSLSFLGGIIYINVPETLNKKLPNSVGEATQISFLESIAEEENLNLSDLK